MKGLKGLFIRKIAITAVFLCVPLLFFPSSLFEALGIPAPQPLMFVRLLGVAYLALIVGYYSGIKALDNNRSPIFAIDMGLVSNGLAGLVFFYFGITGGWSGWSIGAQIYMWLLLAGAVMITLNLFRARKKYAQTDKPNQH
jgi:protein-S-isoprenylcysteine O-methyltransferase Ste14